MYNIEVTIFVKKMKPYKVIIPMNLSSNKLTNEVKCEIDKWLSLHIKDEIEEYSIIFIEK